MSLLIAIGFFALTEGKHVSSSKTLPDGTVIHTNHIHYKTIIQCQSEDQLNVTLCVFAPTDVAVLANMMVAFIVTKAHISPGKLAFLEASIVAPLEILYKMITRIPSLMFPIH